MSQRPAFELLAPGVQRRLYDMGWTGLRPIQADAIRACAAGSSDLLIMAETAGGKTEAAFLPVLSQIAEEPMGTVRALYVGPLRALINDQFARVEDLCQRMEMPVHRWHSDVAASRKNALLKRPGGVLLITPESIESLLINRTAQLGSLFSGLRAVVIDELHAFLGSERGLHLFSLLARLGRFTTERPRRIALSATIGDVDAARAALNADDPAGVRLIRDENETKEVQLRIHSYGAASSSADSEQGELERIRHRAVDLVRHCAGAANLVFANAKGDLELHADHCNELCREAGMPEVFLVHHGSLSAEIREDAESSMKSGRLFTTLCSSTLEMGIDIGSVHMVGQIGAPPSVASLKQRIGRSGRRDSEPRRARLYVDLPAVDLKDPLSVIPLELLRALATVHLMLEGWIEPLAAPRCDLSTLAHQTMALIAETGGATPSRLHEMLCGRGPFRAIDPRLYAMLLRQLGAVDLVEQSPSGELILGLEGEKLRASRDFYAVFAGSDEFHLLHGDRSLGTLPARAIPAVDDHLIFAARRWVVRAVDADRREIMVEPAKNRKRPLFLGGPGDVHARVVEEMRHILGSEVKYRYLDDLGAEGLRTARSAADDHGLAVRRLIGVGKQETLWLAWAGTAAERALTSALRLAGIECSAKGVAIRCGASVKDVTVVVQDLAAEVGDALTLARGEPNKGRRKFDRWLSEELLSVSYAADAIDPEGAQCIALESLGGPNSMEAGSERRHLL